MMWTKTRAAASMLALCLALTACDSPEEREAKYIKRGVQLFEQGSYDKARVEFKNAAKISPTDPEVRYRLGLVDEAQGNLRDAFVNFIRAEEQNARYQPALLKLAQYFLAAERYDEVERRLDIVLTDNPDSAEGHALRAATALRHKDFAGTEKEARLALEKDPKNITAASVLTGLYAAQGDEAKASAAIEAGIAQNPGELSLLQLKVALFKRLENLPKMEEAYQQLFERAPTERRYRVELADTYRELGRIDEAEATLRGGVAAMPEDWQLKQALVTFLSEQRGLEAAEQEVRRYLVAAPDQKDLYFWLADIYIKHKAVDRAVTLLEEVATTERFQPSGLNARNALAKISFGRGDRAVAEKLIAAVLEKDPNNRQALFMRAGIAFDDGQYQRAVSDLRASLRERASPDALQLLAEALLRQGRLDLAIDTQSQLVDLAPTDLAARVRLAQMYHMNGDAPRAVALLTMIAQADESFPVTWETLARINTETKNLKAAEEAIAKLEALPDQQMTATFLRGEMANAQNKPEAAIEKYKAVVKADSDAVLAEHALTAMVNTYVQLQRLDTAAHFIETLRTDSPYVSTVLGECYFGLGKTEAAAAQFDKAIAAGSRRPEPYLDRARLHIDARQMDGAAELLRKGIEVVPGDIQMPLLLAEVVGHQGRQNEAIGIYEALLARNPGLDIAANNMAQLIADHQYTDEQALERARNVAERFQGSVNPLLLDTLSWVYYRQGKIPQALVIAERAAAIRQDLPPQLHYHHGAILVKANRKEDARNQLTKAVADGADYAGIEDARRLLQTLSAS